MKGLALFNKNTFSARRVRTDASGAGCYSSRIATVVIPISRLTAVAGSLIVGSAMMTLVMPDMSGKSSTVTKMKVRMISHPSPYYGDGHEKIARE